MSSFEKCWTGSWRKRKIIYWLRVSEKKRTQWTLFVNKYWVTSNISAKWSIIYHKQNAVSPGILRSNLTGPIRIRNESVRMREPTSNVRRLIHLNLKNEMELPNNMKIWKIVMHTRIFGWAWRKPKWKISFPLPIDKGSNYSLFLIDCAVNDLNFFLWTRITNAKWA